MTLEEDMADNAVTAATVASEDDDVDPEDTAAQGHSLPSPEEIRLNASSSSTEDQRLTTLVTVLGVLLLALVIGLSVGLTSDQRQQVDSSTSIDSPQGWYDADDTNKEERRSRMKDYILESGVSLKDDFTFAGNAQSRALDFLAYRDKMKLNIPTGNISTEYGYKFITRYIMAVFYYSMSGARWYYSLSFLSEHDVCDWFFEFDGIGSQGVRCNPNTLEIIGIVMAGNNLQGTLPREIGFLTTMRALAGIGNLIVGTIPDTFQQLTNLEAFLFPYNLLDSEIPSWFSKISGLKGIFLSDNVFTGLLPESLKELSELSTLVVDDNELSGSIHDLWEMPSLEVIYVNDCKFTGSLPASITATNPALVEMDISGNNIFGALPSDLFQLENATILDFQSNNLQGSFPTDIPENTKLTFFSARNMSIDGSLPTTIGNLQALRHLDLSSNKLTGTIPNEIKNVKNMTYLFLSANTFENSTIPTVLYELEEMRELSLKEINLEGTISPLIGFLTNLLLLDLDNNNLDGTIPTLIGKLTNLEYLLLSRNEFEGTVPTEMHDLSRLHMLLLDNNMLTGSMEHVCARQIKRVYADCNEVLCTCCEPCCANAEGCNDYYGIPTFDWDWEGGFKRDYEDFRTLNASKPVIVSVGPAN